MVAYGESLGIILQLKAGISIVIDVWGTAGSPHGELSVGLGKSTGTDNTREVMNEH